MELSLLTSHSNASGAVRNGTLRDRMHLLEQVLSVDMTVLPECAVTKLMFCWDTDYLIRHPIQNELLFNEM